MVSLNKCTTFAFPVGSNSVLRAFYRLLGIKRYGEKRGFYDGYPLRSHPRGRICLSFSTEPNRSPFSATRWSTCGAVKIRESVSLRLSAVLTSSQVIGVETVGWVRARSE